MISLWSKRWSVSRGWVWKLERECGESIAEDWLTIFQKDEPSVEFKLSKAKPKGN